MPLLNHKCNSSYTVEKKTSSLKNQNRQKQSKKKISGQKNTFLNEKLKWDGKDLLSEHVD